MSGVQQVATITTTPAEAQFLDPCFQSWINRHSERMKYESLMKDPQGVIEDNPEARWTGQNGTNTMYTKVRPASDPSAEPASLPVRFLVSRERRDELLRQRAAWERSYPR